MSKLEESEYKSNVVEVNEKILKLIPITNMDLII